MSLHLCSLRPDLKDRVWATNSAVSIADCFWRLECAWYLTNLSGTWCFCGDTTDWFSSSQWRSPPIFIQPNSETFCWKFAIFPLFFFFFLNFPRNIDENIAPVRQSRSGQTTICQGTVSVTDTALQPAGTTWILPAAIAIRNHRELTHVNEAWVIGIIYKW